jgi:hypothetical protein
MDGRERLSLVDVHSSLVEASLPVARGAVKKRACCSKLGKFYQPFIKKEKESRKLQKLLTSPTYVMNLGAATWKSWD